MENLEEKSYVFGGIFILANRLQVLGDKLDESLTVKQWLLLIGILKNEAGSPTISEVANFIGNSRQNVKKMALILEKKGFLVLKKDSKDARILRMSVTSKCKEHLNQRGPRELEFLEKLYEGFDSDLIRGLNNGITKLEENIASMEENYV